MKKTLLALTITSALSVSTNSHAVEVDFGGDAYVEGVYLEKADGAAGDDTRFYDQNIRAKLHFKGDGGVSVNTRLNLLANTWKGDRRQGGGAGSNYNAESNVDNISLDYGYIQMPLAGWTVRIGRQEANWGFCFTICNDRRDRVWALKKFGSVSIVAVADKRSEGDVAVEGDDLNMYALAAIGFNKGWLWGVLGGYFDAVDDEVASGYGITKNFANLSPFVKGKLGPVHIKAAANFIAGDGDGFDEDGSLWSNSNYSAFVEAGMSFGQVTIEGQVGILGDGGLVGRGWDSYSMLINNNSRNGSSNTYLWNFGGIGGNDHNATIVAARAKGSFGSFWDWSAAAGHQEDENIHGADGVDASVTFVDASLAYNVTKSTNIKLRYGMFTSAKDAAEAHDGRSAATLGIYTAF